MSAADFYKDNTVTLIVWTAAGGGFDYVSRVFASFWPQYAGGPMVVKNMAGGGGLTAHNFMYKAKPDGRTIAIFNRPQLVEPAVRGDPGVEYDFTKFSWIAAAVGSEPNVFGIPTGSSYTSLADLQKAKGLKLPGVGPAGDPTNGVCLSCEILNLDAKVIIGFKGHGDIIIAGGRGELDAMQLSAASYRDAMNKGFAHEPLFTVSTVRTAEFPDVPALTEVVTVSPEMKELLEANHLMSWGEHKLFAAPPGLDEDKRKFLEETFIKIYADKAARKILLVRYATLTEGLDGAEVAKQVEELMRVYKEDLPRITEVTEKYIQR
ncbi:Bug family tripartite tricarboxylate transporter substrate binding protein [Chloroflexota bacterium]